MNDNGIYETRDEELERLRAHGTTVRLTGETWTALQALAQGFRGDELGTPDKVIAKLIADSDARMVLDGLGCETLREAKRLVDLGREYDDQPAMRRDATLEEIEQEPDVVLEAMAAGELSVTEASRHLAQAELDARRQKASR